MKYIYSDDKAKDAHWDFCEKNHVPFIQLSNINKEYINIFFDITNYNISLEEISDDIKNYIQRILNFVCCRIH